MKAVILAGGEGIRLRPLTGNLPKPMVPILNKPFLEHLLIYLKCHNVSSSVLTVSYLPDIIRSHFGNGKQLGVELKYIIEDRPLGTAGAVGNARQELDDTFLVMNGDILTDLDLQRMLAFHKVNSASVTIFLNQVQNTSGFGVVETDSHDRVTRFLEKPSFGETTSNWINGGIYIMEPDILKYIPSDEYYMFERTLFPELLRLGEAIYGFKSDPYWIDIGTPSNYLKVHADLLSNRDNISLANASDSRHKFSTLAPTSEVSDFALLDKGCIVGAHAKIQGLSVLGKGCKIGIGAIVDSSILWENVVIGDGAVLRDCIIGSGVQIGTGATLGSGSIVADNFIVDDGTDIAPGTLMGDSA